MNILQKNMLNINQLNRLEAFDIQPDEYLIAASAACILYGMDIVNWDLDVCMSDAAIKRNRKLLIPGKKDGVHDDMFTDVSGTLDIASGETEWWFSFSTFKPLSIQVEHPETGVVYTFLSPKGTVVFYNQLYELYHKDKHLTRVKWLNKNLKTLEKLSKEYVK